jgi:MFS transporter, PPP family, 3-phenylpropionic acid transporter
MRSLSDRPSLFLRAFYFCYFAAGASLLPFLVLYYKQLGLPGPQIGLLAAIPPLTFLIAAPIWGGLADATQQHRRLLNLALLGTLSLALTLRFRFSTSFLALAVLVMLFAFCLAPIIPLVDSSALAFLDERKNQYGKLRLWGAIGWGLSAPLVGRLVEQHGLNWSFYSYSLFLLAGLILSAGLPIAQASIGRGFWRGLRLLAGNRHWLFFLALIFAAGAGSSLINNYLFLYMADLGASKTLMGLALSVATLSELFIFATSDRLLDHWGVRGLLSLALAALLLRLVAYALLSNPWLVLPVQLLHGFSFSALWVAGVAHADRTAPSGMGATAQAIFSGVSMGLAAAIGAFLGGLLYERLGLAALFGWGAAGLLLTLALLAALNLALRRPRHG